jgi:hypothetical protein
MDIHKLKQRLQNHLTDGLVVIVGSGLSSAEGIPGMLELGKYLRAEIPRRVHGNELKLWNQIESLLDSGDGIEQAMNKCPPTPDLEINIVTSTAELILDAETTIINETIQGTRTLRFARLLKHLLKSPSGIPVITTNYDRLIEIASEMAGLGVDTLFVGNHFGVINEKESRMSFCRDALIVKRRHVRFEYANKVLLLKPHGSLDWYLSKNEPVRCPLSISNPRLIITPGLNKFRTGYDRPFDTHREKANQCIDCASRYLIIGYGFNDDHLQTHLKSKLKSGTPALLLVHTLSDNAKQLVAECDGLIAITSSGDPSISGSRVIDKNSNEILSGPNLWDLEIFVQEVLEP